MIIRKLDYEAYKGLKYQAEIVSDRYLSIEPAGEGFDIGWVMSDEPIRMSVNDAMLSDWLDHPTAYTYEQRHKFRNEKAPKILAAFWSWLEKQHPTKGSRMEKTVTYVRNQKPYAETYLQDGRCSLSNNPSENSIRPFTVGRKNWLFCDTPGGAHASATVYTMVEMAKAHGLNVEKYLSFLLEKRPHADMMDDELEKLSPWSNEARIYCGYSQQIACI
jgi:hypothetical protein